MKTQPKPLTARIAEEILSSLFEKSPLLYRSFIKLLDQWDRNQQDKLTYQKLQQLIKNQPKIIQNLNVHLEQDIQLKIEKSQQQLVQEFLADLKSTNKKAFNKAFEKINQLKTQGIDEDQTIIQELIQTFKDEPELNKRLQQILVKPIQKEKQKIQPVIKKKKQKPAVNIYDSYYDKRRKYDEIYEEDKTKVTQNTNTCTNPNQQIFLIQKFQSTLTKKQYDSLIKIIHLYEIGILSKAETINLLPQKSFQTPQNYQTLKDIIDSRQSQRRKQTNLFKPLTQLNYSQSQRTTHSYVKMPSFYPTKCSGKQKNEEINQLLNIKWVIVPVGSEHTSFNIRAKNPFQQILLKSQDQRYQFDLNLYRYRQVLKILQKIQSIPKQKDQEAESKFNEVLHMGVIQNVYKNASKQQKEQIQVNLKSNRIQMTQVIIQRLSNQIRELQNIRNNYGLKSWHQNSQKNYYKSLDRRCFEFKKHQRQLTKITSFVQQLDVITLNKRPKILNTFQGLSKTEIVHYNKQVNFNFSENNVYNPFLIMYFENQSVKQLLIKLIFNFMQCQTSGTEGLKKNFFDDFVIKYLEIDTNSRQNFQLSNYEDLVIQIQDYLPIKKQVIKNQQPQYILTDFPIKATPKKIDKNKSNQGMIKTTMNILLKESNVGYLPKSQKNNEYSLLYGSQSIYCFFRLFYILYQRILRAFQLCYTFELNEQYKKMTNQQKLMIGSKRYKLFLYILSISFKSKQNSKFQDYLKQIFGEASYIFFSLIKLFQNLVKSAQTCLSEPFTVELLNLFNQGKIQCQQIYLHLINKICLNISNSGRLFRFSFKDNLFYMNHFNSIYKGWFCDKKDKQTFNMDRTISKIDSYMLSKKNILQVNIDQSKKRYESLLLKNNIQYTCIPKSLKLICKNEDFLFRKRRQLVMPVKKSNLIELKRVNKILDMFENNYDRNL